MNKPAFPSTLTHFSFGSLPHNPATHFKLALYAALLHVLIEVTRKFEEAAPGDGHITGQTVFEQFPFLASYVDELADFGLEGVNIAQAERTWDGALADWEKTAPQPLPLTVLCQSAALDRQAVRLLFCIGLPEEDARFGPLYSAMQDIPGQPRPTQGLLTAWWRGTNSYAEVKRRLRKLFDLGLVEIVNPDAPRQEWAFQPGSLLWDALRGERLADQASWCKYRPPQDLPALADLELPELLRQSLQAAPALLRSGEAQTLVVRGSSHDGRSACLEATARQMGLGILEIQGSALHAEPDSASASAGWKLIGPLATLMEALPVANFDVPPGESVELPALSGYAGPLGVILGHQGGLVGARAEAAITLVLDMPGPAERKRLWQHSLGSSVCEEDLEKISARMRLTRGNIIRLAGLARSISSLYGHAAITLGDVQQASRNLNRQALETLSQRLETAGSWDELAVEANTRRELQSLENRCRCRENLAEHVGQALAGQLNCGVRALFSGPSGTGKTLAARLLAASLQMDLYRLDLASVVNKYIGETEKNLSQVFDRAEEQDIILLLDEGDSLLTQRTAVQTANDRYANLETNYLLQRIEAYQGILIITTNAGERIDSAFRRRMDVIVDFRLPEAAERWAIWQSHLPRQHTIDEQFLRDTANRCLLSGAQIRNAVLHASLLALDPQPKNDPGQTGLITTACLEEALLREYRKLGAVCPLRPFTIVTS